MIANSRFLRLSIAALATVGVFSNRAANAAFFEGQNIQASLEHKTASTDPFSGVGPVVVNVGPGVELEDFGFREANPALPALVDVDFSDTQVLITLLIDQPVAFIERLRFVDIENTIPSFEDMQVNPATNWTGFHSGRLLRDRVVFQVSVGELQGQAGQFILLDVVPEPASAGMAATAIAALAVVQKRRRKS